LVVSLATYASVPLADVVLVVQEPEVVRAHVEDDGDAASRVDACGGRVDGELAGRDRDASDTLVADAQDAFRVRDDDEVNLVRAQAVVLHRRLDVLRPGDGEVHAAG